MGTAVSVALISPSTFTDVQAVSEKVRKASQRAYQAGFTQSDYFVFSHFFLSLLFLFSSHEPGQNAEGGDA